MSIVTKVDEIAGTMQLPVSLEEVDRHLGALTRDNARLRKAFQDVTAYARELEHQIEGVVGIDHSGTDAP